MEIQLSFKQETENSVFKLSHLEVKATNFHTILGNIETLIFKYTEWGRQKNSHPAA